MSNESGAHHLQGVELDDGWQVGERVELPDGHTGGAFSVGYTVRNRLGQEGFLKALDYAKAFDAPDPTVVLQNLTAAYNAERALLEQCGTRRFDRVVRALGAGSIRVEGYAIPVHYLILERADGDARDFVGTADPGDPAPLIKLAHDGAVGLKQLHSVNGYHQDFKPSNMLFWKGSTAGCSGKVGDLGSAHLEGRPAPHDDEVIAGTPAHASPEQLYRCEQRLMRPRWRQASDAFMLGNLLVYLLTCGVTYNGMLYRRYLDRSQRWTNWGGTFDEVLPGLIDAHGRIISSLRPYIYSGISERVISIIDELCYPDPDRRGDRIARNRGQNPYNLERYVTRLDLLVRRAKRSLG